MYKLLSTILFFLILISAEAQELNCEVKVTTEDIQVTDPSVFRELERKIFEFLNNTKWTTEKFEEQERIDCSFYLNILRESGPDQFDAVATIKSSRPVYNSVYNTVILDVHDKDFVFTFDPFTTLEYRQNEFANNLTASLAFYAYTIIGLDFDSFGRSSGRPYHAKAKQLVEIAATEPYPGWKVGSTNNRGNLSKYWISENLTNNKYMNIRHAYYDYHRQGLDQMYSNPQAGQRTILNALKRLQTLNKQNKNLPMMALFFNAKRDEIVGVFSKASPSLKNNVVNIVMEIDLANDRTYRKLLK